MTLIPTRRLWMPGWSVAVVVVALAATVHAQQPITVGVQVNRGNDDAEESVASGGINFTRSDLELNNEGGGNPQVIGIRFVQVPVPAGAFIVDVSVVFTVDELDSGPTSVRIFAQLDGDAPAMTADALKPNGRLLIHDVFLNDALDGPLPIALYSAALFTITQGRAYSAAKFRVWLAAAGLHADAVVPTRIHCGVLSAARR